MYYSAVFFNKTGLYIGNISYGILSIKETPDELNFCKDSLSIFSLDIQGFFAEG